MPGRIRLGRGQSAAFDDVARDDKSSREESAHCERRDWMMACAGNESAGSTGGDRNYCGVDLVSTFFGHDFFRGETPFRPSPSAWTERMLVAAYMRK